MENIQSRQAANDCRHDGREQDREWMHITLVKNSQNHIHDENRRKQQQGQGSKKLSKHKRFTLEGSLHRWITRLDLRYRVLDVLRSITNRDIWQQVEIEGNAGELV